VRARYAPIGILSAARAVLEARYTLGLTQAGNPSFSEAGRRSDLMVMAGVAFHP